MLECTINEEGKKQTNENVESSPMTASKCTAPGKGETIKKRSFLIIRRDNIITDFTCLQ